MLYLHVKVAIKITRDKESKEYVGWVKHLETQCDSSEEFKIRKEKIISHINSENYPKLTVDEKMPLSQLLRAYMKGSQMSRQNQLICSRK